MRHLILLCAFLPIVVPTPAHAGEGYDVDSSAHDEFSLGVGLALGTESYKLTGNGFSADLPATITTTVDAQARYRPSGSLWELQARFRHQSVQFAGLAPLSPADVSLSRDRISLLIGLRPFRYSANRWTEGFAIHAGYGFRWNRAVVTTPNAVLLPFDSSGGVLDVTWERTFKHGLGVEARFEVYLPNSFREIGGRTGAHERGIGLEAGASGTYRITERLLFGLGVRYSHEGHTYSGTGSRGVSDATEHYGSWAFPLEVRYAF